jgi:hypothetical protein
MCLASSLCTLLLLVASADAADPVDQGRKALSRWNAFPWYDAKTDSLSPPNLQPTESREWNLPRMDFVGALLRVLAWTLIAAAIAALAVVVIRMWLLSRGAAGPHGARAGPGATALIEQLPMPVDRAHGDLLGEARRLYEQAQYGRAVLYLFAYQLLQLDRNHVIRLARGKTNRQYLREIGARRALGEILQTTMVAFEDVFFGNHPLDQARFDDCWAQLPRFHELCTEAGA